MTEESARGGVRARVHAALEGKGRTGRIVEGAVLGLILLNVVAIVLDSVDSLDKRFGVVFDAIELASVIVFAAEYFMRLWACTADPAYRHPVTGRLRFAARPLAIVDLLSFVPYFLVFWDVDLRVFRAVRLVRFFSVAKLGRNVRAIAMLGSAVRAKRDEFLATLTLAILALVISSTLMYFAESGAQPEKFADIPHALWWAIETLTTVGYGDVVPVTTLGKVLAAILAICGIAMFALPTLILGTAFLEEYDRRRKRRHVTCPDCGKEFEEPRGT